MDKFSFRFLIIAAHMTSMAQANDAIETDEAQGTVVIGVKADFAPEFTWRPFDPSTGKLQSFKVVKNITDEAQKKLSGLFSALGRFGGRDKRYDSNKAGVSYRFAKLSPGTYVLETIAVPGRWTAFNGPVPIVRIVSGKATYVGDYLIERHKSGGRATSTGFSVDDARAFLATFPKETIPFEDDGFGTATLNCRGKLVAFASQIVCDADQSLVSHVAFRERVELQLQPLAN